MIIKRLEIENFRNIERAEADFCPETNVIFGDNAQGKTNLLEAIAYFPTIKAFRTRSDGELITFGQNEARIKAGVFSRNRDFEIDIALFNKGRRKVTLNGVPVKKAEEMSGTLNSVLFAPEDLYIIKSSAAARRKFMDVSLCQLYPRYARALYEYGKLYEHKTRILRDSEQKPSLLEALPEFNVRMAQVGAVIIGFRAAFVKGVAKYAAGMQEEFSDGREELEINYKTVKTVEDPSADTKTVEEQLREHQESHRRAEAEARVCLSGPHKDDIEVLINGNPVKKFGSQGQTRTAALAMKLAEREIHCQALGEYPILLLDDVMSELDKSRQDYVLNNLSGGQVFITCCEEGRLSSLKGGKLFYIKDGRIG